MFRALPNGEVAVHLGYGYRWTDAETGEIKEKTRSQRDHRPRKYPRPPVVECPDHPGMRLQKKRGSPWLSSKTRKLRWQFKPCSNDPVDHPGWTASYGEAPRRIIPRPERRWKGRPRRRLSKAVAGQARREYKKLVAELQSLRKFISMLEKAPMLSRDKKSQVKQHLESGSYKVLHTFKLEVNRFLEKTGFRISGFQKRRIWAPSDLAADLLAPRYKYSTSTFRRNIVEGRITRQ
jgi:hypothetical protein